MIGTEFSGDPAREAQSLTGKFSSLQSCPVPDAAEAWTGSSWPPAPGRAGERSTPPPAGPGTDSDF